jgi:hypothetical protein
VPRLSRAVLAQPMTRRSVDAAVDAATVLGFRVGPFRVSVRQQLQRMNLMLASMLWLMYAKSVSRLVVRANKIETNCFKGPMNPYPSM